MVEEKVETINVLVTGLDVYSSDKFREICAAYRIPFVFKYDRTFKGAQSYIDIQESISKEFHRKKGFFSLILIGGYGLKKDDNSDYQKAVEFTKKNKDIPPILLIDNVLTAVLEEYSRKSPPPNFVTDYSGLDSLTKENIDDILEGSFFKIRGV